MSSNKQDDPRFEIIKLGDISNKDIICESLDKKDYLQVKSFKTVKTGKHGAAKMMIEAVSIRTTNNNPTTGSQSAQWFKVTPYTTMYVFLHGNMEAGEINIQKATDMADYRTVYTREIVTGLDQLLEKEEKLGDDEELAFSLIEYPDFMVIKNIMVRKIKADAA